MIALENVGDAVVATDCPILSVTAPVAPETETPVPATAEVTPVFVTDTAPVAEVFVLNPEDVVKAVTPEFVTVTLPVAPEIPIAVPATTVET
jgi:hypothetical protein